MSSSSTSNLLCLLYFIYIEYASWCSPLAQLAQDGTTSVVLSFVKGSNWINGSIVLLGLYWQPSGSFQLHCISLPDWRRPLFTEWISKQSQAVLTLDHFSHIRTPASAGTLVKMVRLVSLSDLEQSSTWRQYVTYQKLSQSLFVYFSDLQEYRLMVLMILHTCWHLWHPCWK